MFNPATMPTQLKDAFASFSRHSDFGLVRLALTNLVAPFPNLSTSDRVAMSAIIKSDFISTLAGDEADPRPTDRHLPLTREERVGLHLDVARVHPQLMESFNTALKTIALRHSFSGAVGIPAYSILTSHAELSEGVKTYVAAYLHKYAVGLPYLARQLDGTPHASLIGASVIGKYRDSLVSETETHPAQGWGLLKAQPQHWATFEKAATNLKYFGTYAPALKADNVINGTFDYIVDYDEKAHILAVDFRKLDNYHNTMWVHMLQDHELYPTYIVINHLLGALDGNRPGALSADPAWHANQLKLLKPALEKDLDALTAKIKAKKWGLPFTPRAIMPTNP